ncbi:MAG: HIT family protein [Candidatus Anaerobiospirillum merdipullorum]|uniref:HIT family protein n=1 Tax=Candidatus Anaerobiospirillum merdipullorum TaxID=2838450 RepID=A0A9E2NT03_9GAMM|nr:HIT family protein [Candidatus Anaerobiospirillum merdipullorum]
MSTPLTTPCPFCQLSGRQLIAANQYAVAFYDGYPVSPGHTLIVSRRHVASFFDLNKAERQAIDELIFKVKDFLSAKYHPDGYNIGVNVNVSAGQSIMHVHVHVIPRYQGDTPAPKGGVRGVIPHKQSY